MNNTYDQNSFRLGIVTTIMIMTCTIMAQTPTAKPAERFTVGTSSFELKSEITGHSYRLYVQLPGNYETQPDAVYPVYYSLDGHDSFGLAAGIYNGLRYDALVPDVIVIGITYGGDESDVGKLRSLDLTPSHVEGGRPTGGAEKFKAALQNEIFPIINEKYRIDPSNQTLAGTSYGGLFAHYLLFSEPGLFNGYLINCPSYWWDDEFAFQWENNFYSNTKKLSARVMLSSGQFDDVVRFNRMIDQIESHQYNGLTLETRVVEGTGHLGGEAEAISHGMRFIYRRPRMVVSEERLKEYVGSYKLGEGKGTMSIEDGNLMWRDSFYPQGVPVYGLEDGKFSFMGQYLDFHFIRDDEGVVSGFYVQFSPWEEATAIKME